MKKYFLHNGTDQQGPFDIEELKVKNISKETPIWYEGLTEWTNAEKIEELKTIFITVPPPFTTATPPPILKSVVTQQQTTNVLEKRKNKVGIVTYIVIGLLVLGGGVLFLINQNTNVGYTYQPPAQTYKEKIMTVEEIEKSQPANFLIADGKYNENFWGNKLKIHGFITNKATVATYKDAVVRVTYFTKTKTKLGSEEYTIYETFPPNSTKNFELKIQNYKDVNSIGWDVVSAATY